jgi:hypothetical protein
MSQFQPPPTWALPIIKSEATGEAVFNPIWLRWFLDLSAGLSGAGSATLIEVVDAAADTSTWVLLGAAQTGSVALVSDGNLTYNASTNELATTKFAGALNGTVGATTPAAGSFTTLGASGTSALAAVTATSILLTGTAASGYSTGSGGAVTQATSRTTGVTLNKATGGITLFSAAGSPTATTFTVTNSLVAATDVIVLSVKSGTNVYLTWITAVAAGSFDITFYTTGGTATDSPVINFAVIKGVTS